MNKGCILALTLCACMTGCSSIEPPDPSTGKYSTQYPQSVLEYSIYMNKQITVFTNQISTRQHIPKMEYMKTKQILLRRALKSCRMHMMK